MAESGNKKESTSSVPEGAAPVVEEEQDFSLGLVDKLTDDMIWSLLKGFRKFDRDGGGSISTEELQEAMEAMGQKPSPEVLQQMIAEVDVDGDGEVDFAEFVTLVAKEMEGPDTEADIREAFNVFDKDGGGTISAEEMREGLLAMGEAVTEEEIEEMIKLADADGNGEIDYDEFRTMMLQR